MITKIKISLTLEQQEGESDSSFFQRLAWTLAEWERVESNLCCHVNEVEKIVERGA